jgi:hypothetical protein
MLAYAVCHAKAKSNTASVVLQTILLSCFLYLRYMAHLFVIAMFADFAVLYTTKINKPCYATNKKSRQ